MRRAVAAVILVLAAVVVGFATCDGPEAPSEVTDDAGSVSATGEAETERRERTRHRPDGSALAPEAGADVAAPVLWEVRVLGPHDEPAPGVRLVFSRLDDAVSRADGRVDVQVTDPDDAGTVSALIAGVPYGETALTRAAIVRVPRVLPLEVELVDAESGAGVRGVVRRRVESMVFPLRDTGSVFVLDALATGEHTNVTLAVEPPAGYVGREHLLGSAVSPLATRLRAQLPVEHEVHVTAELVYADGRPAADAVIHWVSLDNAWLPVTAGAPDARGATRVRGIPFRRGQRLIVHQGEEVEWATSSEAVVLRDPRRRERVRIVVPGSPDDPVIKDAQISDHNETDNDLDDESPPQPEPNVTVHVHRRGGTPARGVQLALRGPAKPDPFNPGAVILPIVGEVTTDSDGVGRLRAERPNRYVVTAHGPGFVASEVAATTTATDEPITITIHESDSRTIRVRVIDEDGAAVPFARVKLQGMLSGTYVRLVGDEQDLALRTDVTGRLDLPGVSRLAGVRLRLRATYGFRSGAVDVGKSDDVEIKLVAR